MTLPWKSQLGMPNPEPKKENKIFKRRHDRQHDDTQHNNIQSRVPLCFTIINCYAELRYAELRYAE
jgi:hypothetical protein